MFKASTKNQNNISLQKKTGISPWKGIAFCMIIIIVPWALYVNFHPRFDHIATISSHESATKLGQIKNNVIETAEKSNIIIKTKTMIEPTKLVIDDLPILGPIPTSGVQPLFNVKHKGTDAIFALACNYPKVYYQRFVGSLRKFGYKEDIVLAVSPIPKMKNGVKAYIEQMNVVAYEFDGTYYT